MSMTRRNSLEIMAEILTLCSEPCSRSKVVYRAYLSWGVAQEYLTALVSHGLLSIHNSPITYVTTTKGQKFVEKWNRLAELL
jgi:predicted transcriptional regulator